MGAGTSRKWEEAGEFTNVEVVPGTGRLQPRRVSIAENLAVTATSRGGSVETPQPSLRAQGDLSLVADGNPTTAYEAGRIPLSSGDILLDLGTTFGGVRLIRFYPRPGYDDRFMRSFEMLVNDGGSERDFTGNIVWRLVESRTANTESDTQVEIPPQDVRYVLLRFTTSLAWEIAELEVYGEGYVRQGTYVSNSIDFGNAASNVANFSNLRWSAEADPGATMTLVTQSGDTPDPLRYYEISLSGAAVGTGGGFEVVRKEVTREEYLKLDEVDRVADIDTDHWSTWSAPYQLASGESIRSPSPRRYFRFKIDFASSIPESGVRVDSLAFDVSRPPVAHEVVAEISPAYVEGGEPAVFTYALRSQLERGDTGFDALEIATPSPASEIGNLTVGGVSVTDFDQEVEDGRFTLYFPRHRVTRDGTVVQVQFACTVVSYGTSFRSRVFDTRTSELAQPTVTGNATLDLDTDDVVVAIGLGEPVVHIVDIVPNPFTPNSDGINDQTVVTFRLLKLLRPSSAWVRILDLAGAPVRQLPVALGGSGNFQIVWDGRNSSGQRVAPGVYLCWLSARVQAGSGDDVYPVCVAY